MIFMPSFRELIKRYDELKGLTMEELEEALGSWWAHVFMDIKEDIRVLVKGAKKDE